MSTGDAPVVRIDAAMVVDGAEIAHRPGCLVVQGARILAVGPPDPALEARLDVGVDMVLRRPREVVTPALVNAHAHLDLTDLGPVPFGGDFIGWIDMIRRGRPTSAPAIDAAVARGIELGRRGGVAAVGDIAGAAREEARAAAARGGMAGVSYLEVFGTGPRAATAAARLTAAAADGGHGPTAYGLQPHAPYSCGPEVFAAAARLGRPLATHLAESPAERRLLARGDGPLAAFLAAVGAAVPRWDRDHPVDAVLSVWPGPFLAAHVHDVEDAQLTRLAEQGVSVACCPRATDYFGHGPHPYRRMLEAGVNVAIGTDSIVVTPDGDRLTVADDMRHLHRREDAPPRLLLRMATTAGARALGLDPAAFTLDPGPTAGLLAWPIDPEDDGDLLAQVLRRSDLPRWLLEGAAARAGALR